MTRLPWVAILINQNCIPSPPVRRNSDSLRKKSRMSYLVSCLGPYLFAEAKLENDECLEKVALVYDSSPAEIEL